MSLFGEGRIKLGRRTILLRLECFNLLNHANLLGRAQTTYGDTGIAGNTFGQLVSVGPLTNALPALANFWLLRPARILPLPFHAIRSRYLAFPLRRC